MINKTRNTQEVVDKKVKFLSEMKLRYIQGELKVAAGMGPRGMAIVINQILANEFQDGWEDIYKDGWDD